MTSLADRPTVPLVRIALEVTGVVQGVGFRPFVYRLARELSLTGWITNDRAGVRIEVEGAPEALAVFEDRLSADAPRLSAITSVITTVVAAQHDQVFSITESQDIPSTAAALIPPDVAPCPACLSEIADPADRRYRYPFGNCTDCGPRFTVITGTPYDRSRTTMADFALCADCRREYTDPVDRRFHAEPIACPACGPRLTFTGPGGPLDHDAALLAAQDLLAGGGVLAVKGVGGYHLACDATNADAVATLRSRKHRPDKPFALLVPDVEAADRLAEVSAAEAELLASPVRPIVLLLARTAGTAARTPPIRGTGQGTSPATNDPAAGTVPVAAGVAPGVDELGIALPASPLHVLLLAQAPGRPRPPQVLVLTSGNASGEPIAHTDADQIAHLVDGVLDHDRPILLPCDDSVLRVTDGRPLPLRRSRGCAPAPIVLAEPVRPVLSVGGDLKGVGCLAAGRQAWLTQHVGDVGSLAGANALEASCRHLVDLLRIIPEVVAADLHPDYASSRVAARLAEHFGVPLVRVQHHHAHLASAAADAAHSGPAVGIALDGTGYGPDETIWGGELLGLDGRGGWSRLGHLRPVRLPGADAATEKPARSALAHLHAAGISWSPDLAPVAACTPVELGVLARQLETGFGTTASSSMGRLFDAVAALLGVRQEVSYEAQAALELEALVAAAPGRQEPRAAGPGYRFAVGPDLVSDAAPVVRGVVADLRAGVPAAEVGARFTRAVAELVIAWGSTAAAQQGTSTVLLSGGVFAHRRLGRDCRRGLEARGLRVRTHTQVPCGDGGLALGQAVVAGRLTDRQAAQHQTAQHQTARHQTGNDERSQPCA